MCGTAAVIPALIYRLAGACNGKCAIRHILGHRSPSGSKDAVPQADRGNEVGIAADEAVITNHGLVFVVAVIIDNNRSAAEIDSLADLCVADIGEVRYLGAVSNFSLFEFDKVPDTGMVANLAARADIGKGRL